MKKIEVGMINEVEWMVEKNMLASAVGSGSVEVFSTPMCMALLENAAAGLVQDSLEEGVITVGTMMFLKHIAATPEGMWVRGEAVLTAMEGRRYIFDVTAYDEKEKIAEGTHERFSVRADRFEEKAREKLK